MQLELIDEPLPGSQLDERCRVAGLYLVHDVLAVGFDGALAGEVLFGNFGVGEALGYQAQYFLNPHLLRPGAARAAAAVTGPLPLA